MSSSSLTPGTRVVAICVDSIGPSDVVRIYGHGVYAGDFPRPRSGDWSEADMRSARAAIKDRDADGGRFDGQMAAYAVAKGLMTQEEADAKLLELARYNHEQQQRPLDDRARELLERISLNSRIDLDNGGHVWGYECWWGAEADWPGRFAGRRIEIVPPPDRNHT